MSMKLNKWAYEQLITENIVWLLENTDDTLERRHILDVLQDSVQRLYPDTVVTDTYRGLPQNRINETSVFDKVQMACPNTVCITNHGESKCYCKLELERKETEEEK